MSIEPTCDYCGASDKYRCKNEKQTANCWNYIGINSDKTIPADSAWIPDELDNVKISVYMDFGSVYTYYVHPDKAREHASAIVQTGYRHTPKGSDDLEWFPPYRILKVAVENGGKDTNYKGDVRAT